MLFKGDHKANVLGAAGEKVFLRYAWSHQIFDERHVKAQDPGDLTSQNAFPVQQHHSH